MNDSFPPLLNLPHAIYNDSRLDGNAKLLLCEIFNLLRVNRHHCWASNDHFAQMFGLTRGNVSFHINKLVTLGWITSEAIKHCSMEECTLKDKGWHRHIRAGKKLSSMLDSLSNTSDRGITPPTTPLSNTLDTLSSKPIDPIKSVGTISNTIENNKRDICTNVQEKPPEKKEYGNPQVNTIVAQLKSTLGLAQLDGSQQDNRNFANLLIRKYGYDAVLALIPAVAKDRWWHGRITSTRKLYYNATAIMSNAVGRSYGANNVAIDPSQL